MSPSPSAPPRNRSRWRLAAWLVAALALLPLMLLGIAGAMAWQQLPELSRLTDYQPKEPLRIHTSDGVLIGEFGTERRRFVPLDEIPKALQDALLAVEDAEFWTHPGLDFSGMLRAAWRNVTHSGPRHGASTITQQLARDTFLTKEQLWTRKLVEVLLALKMERELSKAQILEIYMNQIFMGNRAYGFASAAERYFGKELKELNTAEIAMLVALPKDPVRVNPSANLPRAKKRQAVVLDRLRQVGLLSAEEAEAAKQTPLSIRRPKRLTSIADHVAEMVRAEVVGRYGEDAYQRGLQVTTTLLSEEQRAAQAGLRRALFDLERRQTHRGAEAQFDLPEPNDAKREAVIDRAFDKHPDLGELKAALVLAVSAQELTVQLSDGSEHRLPIDALRPIQSRLKAGAEGQIRRGSLLRLLNTAAEGKPFKWVLSQAPQAEGAVVTLDPKTGDVRSLVGGFDFARGQYNHATQAYRQPGSSFKPFIYSALMEEGGWDGTLVSDQPFEAGDWAPRNYDGKYESQLTLRQAIARSKNMVSIRLVDYLGVKRVRDWVSQFGLNAAKQPTNLTIALGTGAVTPLQMASAYAVFANGGLIQPVRLIEQIGDAQGNVLFKAPPPGEGTRAIPARNAFMTNQLLSAVMREGTGAKGSAMLQRWDLYGKTGTTNDAVDAWFAGFHASRVGVVWIGYPQPRSLGERETGGGLALPVWVSAMQVALNGQALAPLLPPNEGLVLVDGHWFYQEFTGEMALNRIGLPPPEPPAESASDLLALQPDPEPASRPSP
jgi:penicillin-binding protein 1A